MGTGDDHDDTPAGDDPVDDDGPRYPNELARRVAKAVGVSTHRPPNGAPGPS